MTESFTFGDAAKYSASNRGKTLIIDDWELFDRDWGILKEKAIKYDEDMAELLKQHPSLMEMEASLSRRYIEMSHNYHVLVKKAEKYDAINWKAIKATLDEKIVAEDKLEAVKKNVGEMRTTTHGTWKLKKLIDETWKILEEIEA